MPAGEEPRRPRLAPHVRLTYDRARGRHVLLTPETVTVLNGTGAMRSQSASASTHEANSRPSRMCSRSRASMPDRPKARRTIQSFSARKRRPSWGPQSM